MRLGRVLGGVAAAVASLVLAAPAQADTRVGGEIGVRYDALGGEAGLLGAPRSPEIRTPNGKGAYVAFDRGSIYWSPWTGAWETHGEIRAGWGRLGWENGYLGFPITNEITTPNGRGAYNAFEGGSIYFSPVTGAHAVRGLIRDAYAWAGWENGRLGFPTTSQIPTPNGRGAYNVFQGGSIYWGPGIGAHVVWGAIRDAWAATGWESGQLGFPTSSEFDIPGGKRVNFERGFIEWSAGTGARVNRTLTDSGIPGCPVPHQTASISQAAQCFVRGWEQDSPDVSADYASMRATSEMWGVEDDPEWRFNFSSCERSDFSGYVESAAGMECYFTYERLYGPYESSYLVLGMAERLDGWFVEDVEFIAV
ncbi:LGFP repeat-containing protein [Kineococcus gypseus]|uniref:LGFP repeat-containing protein n=1 Tax=Kineococcus gypseus TaxID=1637102 RepID=UPI003D7D586D